MTYELTKNTELNVVNSKERHNGWKCQQTRITDADLKLLHEQAYREEKGSNDL